MIDTIFYFCPTQEQYEQTLTENGGEGISSKTITFVEDVREIYFNGRGYGKTSTAGLVSEDEFNAWKNAILGRLGSIDDKQAEHDNALDDISSKFLEAQSDIDDINAYIEDLLARITNTNTKLQEEIDGLSDKINQEVLDQLEDADSLINQALDGKMETAIGDGLNAYQGFVTTDNATWADLVLTYNNVKSTVNQVGYLLDDNGNIKYTSAIQSLINQGIENNQAFLDLSTRYAWLDDEENVIKWMTSGFKSRTGEANSFAELFAAAQSGIDADALASLKTEILNDADGRYVAEGNFSTRVSGFLTSDDLNGYAQVESLSDLALKSTMEEASANLMASYGINNKTTIAGINATANENWARISAITSRDGNNAVIFNESKLDSAIAGLLANTNSSSYAKVQAAATTDSSGVDITAIVQGAMSGYATEAYADGAANNIKTYLTDGNGNVITSSSLKTLVDKNTAKLDAIANWNGWVEGQPVSYTSQWVLQSSLEGSVAGFIASGSNNLKAAITAYVNSNDSGITLSADHITLDGDVIASRLTSANATIGGFRIYDGYLWAESGNNRLQLSPSSGITFSTVGENTSSVQLSMDGSGHLAKGNISWTTAGAVTMTNAVVTGTVTATNGTIGGFLINGNTLTGTNGNNIFTLDPTGGISLSINNSDSFKLNIDGSGLLAGGNINWDNTGAITMQNATITGAINATSGHFTGEFLLGDFSDSRTTAQFKLIPYYSTVESGSTNTSKKGCGAIIGYDNDGNQKMSLLSDGKIIFKGSRNTEFTQTSLTINRAQDDPSSWTQIALSTSYAKSIGKYYVYIPDQNVSNEATFGMSNSGLELKAVNTSGGLAWITDRSSASFGGVYLDGDVLKVRTSY